MTAAIALFTLAGCVTAVTPPPPTTEADVDALFDEMLAKSWVSTGLAESMEQPTVVSERPLAEGEWINEVFVCMKDNGFPALQIGYQPHTGYLLEDDPASVPVSTDPAAQLAFFECLAKHPFALESTTMLTRAQLDFTYDYYQDVIFPCLAHNGFLPHLALSREKFIALEGGWSPYRQVWAETQPRVYQELIPLCGPEYPAFD